MGSQLGSWVGGRIGLMVYDVANGVHYLVQFVQTAESALRETPAYEKFEAFEDITIYEAPPSVLRI